MHLLGRKKSEEEKEEQSLKLMQVPSSALHSLIWEMLHLLGAIVQHSSIYRVPV